MKILSDVLPTEFLRGEYHDTKAFKLKDVEVFREVDGTKESWPGKAKNVLNWYILVNGKCVGWNENPSRGWSFPVV